MKVYIVYKEKFETDKPREYMTEPEILLGTANKDKTLQEIKNTKQKMSKHIYNSNEYGFEYDNDVFLYGTVGIIEEELIN